MIKSGDTVEVRIPNGPLRIGDKFTVEDVERISDNSFGIRLRELDTRRPLPLHFFNISLDFLNKKFQYGTRVNYYVKKPETLIGEGWERTKSGSLKKTGAYYRFTKKKMSTCGTLRLGIVKYNPKGKTCIEDSETGWNYDESMVKYIKYDEDSLKEVSTNLRPGLDFLARQDGKVLIGNLSLNKVGSRKLMKSLLEHHRWILEDEG